MDDSRPIPTAAVERLLDLLDCWRSLAGQGHGVTAAEVCGDCPELAGPLEQLARFVSQVETLAGDPTMQATDVGNAVGVGQAFLSAGGKGRQECLPHGHTNPSERYAFEGKLGEGGMGAVYRARDHSLGRTVALKVIRPEAMSRAARERFEIEARAVAQLDHPHIVKVFDVGTIRPPGESEPVPFFTLEYVDGGSLAKRLDGKPLAPMVTVGLVALLARAVQHAHEHGIVHRDLKPENVLLAPPSTVAALNTPLGCPRVTDFGLAKLLAVPASPGRKPGEYMTQPGTVMGTPHYMAPEQAEGSPAIGPPADVWALGVILYQLLTGRLPFLAPSLVDLLHQICRDEPDPLRDLLPGTSTELADLVRACLRKQPAERPTAEQLAERLERLRSTTALPTRSVDARPAAGAAVSPSVRATPEGSASRPSANLPLPRRGSRRAPAAILAALVAAVLAGMMWYRWPDRKLPDPPPGSATASPAALRIKPLQVMHYATIGDEAEPRGKLGEQSFATRHGDAVTLTVELSAPAYCFVIGFNFDGIEQLLWPLDAEGKPSDQVAPPRVDRLHLPLGAHRLYLDDPAKSGLQAYVVAASSRPLPPYSGWRAERQGVVWKPLPPGKTAWQADAAAAYAVVPGLGADRGSIKESPGVPPLAGLCRALKSGGVDAVEAIAFPVLPKE